MNTAHLHLMITHLPLVGLLFTLFVSIVALIKNNDEIRKLSLWSFAIVGASALLAYFTGDGAEEILLTYPGISEEIIETHEAFALAFLIGVGMLALASIFVLVKLKSFQKALKRISLMLLLGAFLVSVIGVFTGATGGKIRHTEIENGAYKAKV